MPISSMDHRIPPPLVWLACALLVLGLDRMWPAATMAPPWRWVPALALAVAGLAVAGAGVLAFRRARTTVNPHTPQRASTLVTCGIYRVTRNPMYLGLAMAQLGWATWLATPVALLAPVLFVAYITRWQILPEERALAVVFGGAFADYRRRTRRWL